MKVGISFLSAENQEEAIKKIESSLADFIHVDWMDGIFVENSNYTIPEIKKLLNGTNKKLDFHMMASSPNKYVKELSKIQNIEYITFHYEAHRKPIDVINMIHRAGKRAGIAINPETKVHKIIPMLPLVDLVLVMSVKPGKGGQKFIEDILYKIETLKDTRNKNNFHYLIEVDGGINDKTAKMVKEAGADLITVGSYAINNDDLNKIIETVR